mmetsp:Transcript_21196/g.59657  ORF Transcript_21196/g.59657 Transcript_21196/m.59657 type:complete len:486 (+) Transcript_21196:2171-3628(+)
MQSSKWAPLGSCSGRGRTWSTFSARADSSVFVPWWPSRNTALAPSPRPTMATIGAAATEMSEVHSASSPSSTAVQVLHRMRPSPLCRPKAFPEPDRTTRSFRKPAWSSMGFRLAEVRCRYSFRAASSSAVAIPMTCLRRAISICSRSERGRSASSSGREPSTVFGRSRNRTFCTSASASSLTHSGCPSECSDSESSRDTTRCLAPGRVNTRAAAPWSCDVKPGEEPLDTTAFLATSTVTNSAPESATRTAPTCPGGPMGLTTQPFPSKECTFPLPSHSDTPPLLSVRATALWLTCSSSKTPTGARASPPTRAATTAPPLLRAKAEAPKQPLCPATRLEPFAEAELVTLPSSTEISVMDSVSLARETLATYTLPPSWHRDACCSDGSSLAHTSFPEVSIMATCEPEEATTLPSGMPSSVPAEPPSKLNSHSTFPSSALKALRVSPPRESTTTRSPVSVSASKGASQSSMRRHTTSPSSGDSIATTP